MLEVQLWPAVEEKVRPKKIVVIAQPVPVAVLKKRKRKSKYYQIKITR